MEDEWEDVPFLPPSISVSEDEHESFLIEVDDVDNTGKTQSNEGHSGKPA